MTSEHARHDLALAVLLGASEWPRHADFTGSEAFANSSRDFKKYLQSHGGMGLPESHILDLFDKPIGPDAVQDEMVFFFDKARKQGGDNYTTGRDVIIHYVGHGGFNKQDQYFLALRNTRGPDFSASSLMITTLAAILSEFARGWRRFLILDSCFAASAFDQFQDASPLSTATRQSVSALPAQKGTALLCASSSRGRAKFLKGQRYTMFSDALLNVLKQGDPSPEKQLSLRKCGDLVLDYVFDKYADEAVRPEVQVPDAGNGRTSIADVGLFPNPAYALPETKVVEAVPTTLGIGNARPSATGPSSGVASRSTTNHWSIFPGFTTHWMLRIIAPVLALVLGFVLAEPLIMLFRALLFDSMPASAPPLPESASPRMSDVDASTRPVAPPPAGAAPPSTAVKAATPGRFPEVSTRVLTQEEANSMTCIDLRIARNEIFARYGYRFRTEAMRTYFNGQSWYSPRSDDVSAQLSDRELRNIKLIQSSESEKGC